MYGSPVLLGGIPAASGSAPVQPSASVGRLSGADVVVRSGVVPFLQSLYPGYLPPQLQSSMQRADGPAFTIDSGNGQSSGFLHGTELAARVVSAYAMLPTEIGTLVGGFVMSSAAARFAWDQLSALVATADTPPGQSRADSTVASSQTNDRDKKKKTTQPIRQRSNPPATAPVGTGQLTKTAVALGALSSLTAAGAATASDSKTVRWIEVAKAETLGKIGRDPAYPLDGRYRQLADIDASGLSKPIGNETHPFIGEYDGRCHCVDKLGHCFVQKLDGNGRIDNVRFTRADIVSSEKTGVVACELFGHSALGNIEVEHSAVWTNRKGVPAGIGAGVAREDTLIEGFSTFNCTTRTEENQSPAGGVAGDAYGTIDHSRLDGALIEVFGRESDAGGGAGVVRPGAKVANTLLVNSSLLTAGSFNDAGGGGGKVWGTVVNTTMVDGEIKSIGSHARVAVGAGQLFPDGEVYNTTGYRVKIITTGGYGDAAVGAGLTRGLVKGVVCFESSIAAEGKYAAAGFGVGWLTGGFVSPASPASAADIVASSCNVSASGNFSAVGFGGGRIWPCNVSASGNFSVVGFCPSGDGDIRNLTVLSSRAESTGREARSCIGGGGRVLVCDASLGSKGESVPGCNDQAHDDCHPVAEDTCKFADRRVLTENCQPVAPPYFYAEKVGDFVCPALPNSTAGATTTLSPITGTPSSLTTDASSLATTDASSPATTSALSPTTTGALSPTTAGALSPTTAGASSPATTGASSPATTGASSPTTTSASSSTITGAPSLATTATPSAATTNASSLATTSSSSYALTTPVLPIETNATSVVSVNMTNHTMPSLMPVASPVPLVLSAPIAATRAGAMAGGIVAGVVVLGLAAGAGYVLYRRYYPQSKPEVEVPLKNFDEL